MSELSNGKLLKEIHEKVVRLDEWKESVNNKLDIVTDVFKPNGLCSKTRAALSNIKVQVGIQWAVLFAMLVYLVIKQVA